MKKFFFDMDGVLAEYKNGCDESDLAQKGYFRNLAPEENMVKALSMLLEDSERLGIRLCVLTKVYPSLFPCSLREKEEWRREYLPDLFDSEFIMVNGEECEKSEAISALLGAGLNEDYFLIDDYNQNLAEWAEAGGTPVKYVNAINDTHRSFVGHRLSYQMTPQEIYDAILAMAGILTPAPVGAAA